MSGVFRIADSAISPSNTVLHSSISSSQQPSSIPFSGTIQESASSSSSFSAAATAVAPEKTNMATSSAQSDDGIEVVEYCVIKGFIKRLFFTMLKQYLVFFTIFCGLNF